MSKLNDAICDESNRPYRDIRISHTIVLHDPFEDPPGLSVPSRSPSPSLEILKSSRIGPDEEIDDEKGKTLEEIEEVCVKRAVERGGGRCGRLSPSLVLNEG